MLFVICAETFTGAVNIMAKVVIIVIIFFMILTPCNLFVVKLFN